MLTRIRGRNFKKLNDVDVELGKAVVESLREAYRKSIPRQVWASMEFEGEHVDIKMLEEHLKNLKGKKKNMHIIRQGAG